MNEELENELDDKLRPHYDFANMKGGVRGKYVERYREGTNVIKGMIVAELRAYAIAHPQIVQSSIARSAICPKSLVLRVRTVA